MFKKFKEEFNIAKESLKTFIDYCKKEKKKILKTFFVLTSIFSTCLIISLRYENSNLTESVQKLDKELKILSSQELKAPLMKRLDLTMDQKMEKIKSGLDKYHKTSSLELLVYWMSLFHDKEYKMNGNPRWGEFDCSGAMAYYFWQFGMNVAAESVKDIEIRARILAKLPGNRSMVKKRYRDIEKGDIILFKGNSRGFRHCGVVYKTQKNKIMYMDMTSNVGTGWCDEVSYGANNIALIFRVTLPYSMGELITD